MKHAHPIRAVVFDIDGTLALMDKKTGSYQALPGATDAISACMAQGLPVVAYTNGTFFPPEHYYAPLAAAGLQFEAGHILTPATVSAQQLKHRGIKRVMLIGDEGTRVPLEQAGISCVEATSDASSVEAVMLGWTKSFTSAHLEAAAQAIWRGAPLFATSVAPYFAGSNGKLMGVSGAVAAALQNATGAAATVFGKPSIEGLNYVAERLGVPAHEMVVIGDDPNLEIAMARKAGAFAVGVTSGVADAAAFERVDVSLRAHIISPSLERLADQSWLQ
jgi:4-nitrophenyl phosphatase